MHGPFFILIVWPAFSIIYAFDLHSTLKPIEMAERFKLKTSRAVSLSRVIPSLQICRPKGPSDSVYTPVPAIHRLSPVDSKVFDISFPSNLIPSPPPTTPECHFIKRRVSTKVECGCGMQELSTDRRGFRSQWKKDLEAAPRCHVVSKDDHQPKLTINSNDNTSPVWVSKNKIKTTASLSSRDGGCSSNEEGDESETTQVSSSTRSLSNYYSTGLDHYSPDAEDENGRKKKNANTNIKQIRRHRRKASDMTTVAEVVDAAVKASVFRRKIIPGTVEGKVRESVAVAKKSVDPYEDFKRSMLEMILQKQMFEAKDLEQLLLCFLSLNSSKYHQIIVEAFSDIWEILFCD